MTVGGLILAAGEGRRFGATKQLAELRGRPLLEYAVESMLSVPAWPVIVVLGHDADAIRAGIDLGATPGRRVPRLARRPGRFAEVRARRARRAPTR